MPSDARTSPNVGPNQRRRAAGPLGMLGFVILFITFWTMFVCLFDAYIAYGWYKTARAKSFATALGTVLESRVQSDSGGDTTHHSPFIRYEYTVAGARFESTRYRYAEIQSNNFDSAKRIVDAHPVGRQMTVYYNKDDPADSVLLVVPDGEMRMMPLFMTPFNLVMIGGWLTIGTLIARRRDPSRVAGLRTIDQPGGETIVNLDVLPVWAPFFIGAIVVSFFSIFIVVLSLGAQPSLITLVVVWGASAAVGIAASAWYASRIASGRYRLVIDPVRRTISFPPCCDSLHPEAAFASIDSIDLRTDLNRTTNGMPHTQVVVNFKSDRSSRQESGGGEAVVSNWANKNDAILFRDYLAERLGLKDQVPAPPPQAE